MKPADFGITHIDGDDTLGYVRTAISIILMVLFVPGPALAYATTRCGDCSHSDRTEQHLGIDQPVILCCDSGSQSIPDEPSEPEPDEDRDCECPLACCGPVKSFVASVPTLTFRAPLPRPIQIATPTRISASPHLLQLKRPPRHSSLAI